jgi:hypothetical protein
MRYRFLSSMGALAVVAAVMPLPAAGQAPATAAKTAAPARTTKPYTQAKTPWGDPDLQGIWNNATSTPMQRPAGVGEKGVLTEQEADQFAEELAENLNRDRRDGGPEADVARAYNEHWMDARRLEAVKDRRTSLIVDPPNGRIPPLVPLTPERIKARDTRAAAGAAFLAGAPTDPEETAPPFRCIIRTDLPPYLPIIYNNDFQIFQSPGFVAIAPEMIHSARIIPLDGRPHLGKTLLQWLGDTRGHWEGNTLVVETTNFRRDTGAVYQNANPDTFKITERFTRVDADRINYEFTVSDPTTWTRPWTAMIPWNKADGQLFEYACHEGNYDMVHLMAGGRKREKEGQTIAAPVRPGAGNEER